MTGNELIDGIGKLINIYYDIFSAILYSLLKPILNNPSNFGNEPQTYLGNLALGIIDLIIGIAIIYLIYRLIGWLLSVIDNESIFKESIHLSLTTEIIGLHYISNNFTFVKFIGDIIGLSIIFYVMLLIGIFIAEKIH